MVHHELAQTLLEFHLHLLFSLCLGLILLDCVWMLLSKFVLQISNNFVFIEELTLEQSKLISQMLILNNNLQILVLCSLEQTHYTLLVVRHSAWPLGICCTVVWCLDVSGKVAVQVHLSWYLLERIEI